LLHALRGQGGADRLAAAAWQGGFLERHQDVVVLGGGEHGGLVERLEEAHVDQRGVEYLGDLGRRRHHAAEGEQGHAPARAPLLGAADLEGRHLLFDGRARAGALGVAHGGGAIELQPRVEHLAALVLVGRGHQGQVGQAAHVGMIEIAEVRGPVLADETGAVEGEQHGQVLHGHIVHELIKAPLQEGRIDGDDGLLALAGQTSGKG